MKTILFPTDFSANANHALLYALKVADKMNAELRFFHSFKIPVFDTSMPLSLVEGLIEEEEKSAHDKMQAVINENPDPEIRELLSKIKVGVTIKKGFVIEGILEDAEEHYADMIVMGTKGAGGLAAAILGSNTTSVIAQLEIPILAVPEEALFNGFQRTAFASNLAEDELPAIEFFVNVSEAFGSQMYIFHVSPKDNLDELYKLEFFKRRLSDKWDLEKFMFITMENNDIENALHYLVVNHKIDMLAMLTHHHGFFRRIFSSSLTNKMAYHTHIPLFAFHSK